MVLWFFDFGAKFNTDIKVVGTCFHIAEGCAVVCGIM